MIGQKLGNYRIVEQIGTGRMTTIYKAHDPGTNHYVAIKILPQHYFQDPAVRTRFQREADAVATLDHPHILPIFAYRVEENGVSYVATLYMPAGTLRDRIGQVRLSLPEAAAILGQVGGALDYAHGRGIVHQDVKPSNILFAEDGNVFVSDFAVAGMFESGMIGTPEYMSPEQCMGETDLGPASDQYSLGVIAYEMLTGRIPFQAGTPDALIHMHLSDPVPPPRSLRPDLPESVQAAILRALAKEPGDRWPACSAIAGALSRAFF